MPSAEGAAGHVVHLTKGAPPYDVDALRLLRMVHLRRVLRTLCVFETLAIPLWAGFSLTAEAVYDRSSPAWQRIDDETGPGFAVILLGLVATFALLLVVGRLGRAGRLAARLRPIFRPGDEPRFGDGPDRPRALVARLRRKGYLHPGPLFLFLLVGGVTVVASLYLRPAWLANHGRGGDRVTIGQDAFIAYSNLVQTRYGAHRDYFLSTPDGTAIAETYHPHDGEHWTVVHDAFGNIRAYLIGGHDYLLMLSIVVMCVVIMLGAVWFEVRAVREERRLRAEAGDGDLAADVAALAAGARTTVRVGSGPATVLGLRPLGRRSAHRLLARRRAVSGGASALLAVTAVTLVGLQQAGFFTPPPTDREVTLGYLAGSGWDPQARAFYGEQSARAVYRDDVELADVGDPAQVSGSWSRVVTRRTGGAGAGDELSADVDLARIGALPPARVTSAVIRGAAGVGSSDGGTEQDVSGLPPGWSGVVTVPAARKGGQLVWPTVELATATRGLLVTVTVDGLYSDARGETHSYAVPELERWAAELAGALDDPGLSTLANDTVRPEHG